MHSRQLTTSERPWNCILYPTVLLTVKIHFQLSSSISLHPVLVTLTLWLLRCTIVLFLEQSKVYQRSSRTERVLVVWRSTFKLLFSPYFCGFWGDAIYDPECYLYERWGTILSLGVVTCKSICGFRVIIALLCFRLV